MKTQKHDFSEITKPRQKRRSCIGTGMIC